VCDGLAKHCHPSYQLHAVGAGWISLAQQKHAQWDTRTPKAARRPTPPYTNKVCVCSSGEGSRGQAFGLWAGSGAYGGAGTARNNVASQPNEGCGEMDKHQNHCCGTRRERPRRGSAW
jgi:hypothetical protein